MSTPTYYELLRHPEWQKKRLKIMERDGFACRQCGDNTTTLNVHHSYYTKGAKPWEYPDDSLRCLCEPCHKLRHLCQNFINETVGLLPLRALSRAVGYSAGLWLLDGLTSGDTERMVRVPEPSEEPDWFEAGLADVFGLSHGFGHWQYTFTREGVAGEWIDCEALLRAKREYEEAAALDREPAATRVETNVSASNAESGRSVCGDCRA